MKSIVLLTSGHVCHNPRVVKEADALAAGGYQVEVMGVYFDRELTRRDEELASSSRWTLTPVLDLTASSLPKKLWSLYSRGRTRLGIECFRRFGWSNPLQLGYAALEMFRVARRRQADLYISHLEQGMWVGDRLQRCGLPVGVDFEDWYSENFLNEVSEPRPAQMLQTLERRLLVNSVHRTCASQAMSAALASAYDVAPPLPIYNTFPWSDRANLDGLLRDRRDLNKLSIHWFSQTIGEGRGLEDLFLALKELPRQFEVHLRGKSTPGIDAWISRWVPTDLRESVILHPLVDNRELLSRITEHDVGFAGEQPNPRSRETTVTNKVFQYLLAGLAVAASNTSGQREVLESCPAAAAMYAPGDFQALARILLDWHENPAKLKTAKAAALEVAQERYCWEQEAERLLGSVANAVGQCPTVGAMS